MNYLLYRLPILILLAGFCLWVQTHTFINSNILWLLHVGDKLLAGGKYYYDFIEVNPPLCIYIYLPAVILNHALPISFINSIILYLFLLVIASWLFCSYLLNKIFADSATPRVLYGLEFALAFSYFILPAYNFGEREYLLIVLILPYLLMAVLRLSQQPIRPILSITAGVLAAAGFAQKPYFMPVWSGIELYLLAKTKSLKINFRPEALACISVLIIYGISIVAFTPEYITRVLPLITPTYYLINKAPAIDLIKKPAAYFPVLLIALSFLLRKQSVNKALIDVLIIALTGSLFIYLAQRTLWDYHMLPVFMSGSLLLALLIAEFLPQYSVLKMTAFNSYFYKSSGLMAAFALLTAFPLLVAVKSINGSFFYTQLIFKQPVFQLLQQAKGKTVYIFTSDQIHNYLLLDYSKTVTPSRFPSLWLIEAANALATSAKEPDKQQLAHRIADFVRQSEITAILQAKPAYILLQQYDYKITDTQTNFLVAHLAAEKIPITEYIKFFLQDKKFALFWRQYQFIGKMGNFAVYKIR